MHHIVSDGWSRGIFNRELTVLYEACCEGRKNPLKQLVVQYADFAMWQRNWLEDGALEEGLSYWKERLKGIPEELQLPMDRPRPVVRTFAGEACQGKVGEGLTGEFKRVSREAQATLYMTLLAGFGGLRSRYNGQEDIAGG